MEVKSLQEWFGLKNDRYAVDPIEAEILAFNNSWAEDMYRRVSRLLVTGIAPKVVLIHRRGDGKTHVSNWIAGKIKIVEKIYVSCPPLTRGSTYLQLHRAILSELNRHNILTKIINSVWNETVKEGVISDVGERKKKLELIVKDRDLSSLIVELKTGAIDISEFYQYLRGEKARGLDILEPVDSSRAVQLLQILANLYQHYFQKLLFIILDEVDNITEARQKALDFKEAFRKLAEVPNIGLVLIVNLSPEDELSMESIPSPLKDRGVQTRIGTKNYLIPSPPAMRVEDIDAFIKKTNEYLRGEKAQEIVRVAKKEYGKDFDESLFPFTKSGFETFKQKIVEYVEETKEDLLPRSVLSYANECLGEAVLSDKRAVDKSIVEAVGNFSQ